MSTYHCVLQAAMTAAQHLPPALLSTSTFHRNSEIEMNNRIKCLMEHALCSELSVTLDFHSARKPTGVRHYHHQKTEGGI